MRHGLAAWAVLLLLAVAARLVAAWEPGLWLDGVAVALSWALLWLFASWCLLAAWALSRGSTGRTDG